MRNNSDILDFRIFLAIFDLRSFRAAAETLRISQPALTRRLQALEEAFGATLFERTTRHVSPSQAGRELEPGLRRLLREFEDCMFTLNDTAAALSGPVTIACVPTAASAFLPQILTRFHASYPDVRFRIRDLSPREGLECVGRGEAEFGITTLGSSHGEFRFTPLLDDPFVVACRFDHPLAAIGRVSWRELKNYPLIVSERSDNRALIDQALARHDLQFEWRFQVGHVATSFGLVEEGLGVSVIPRLSRPMQEHPLIKLVSIVDPVVFRTVGIAERRGRQLSHAASRLRDMIISVCATGYGVRAPTQCDV